ncbi:unnamed protein product [Macrosiphum euphorbiae]|uniref:Uncharacterized protein n=1 Tax=Macrosiphum euphorbiae TaxID=13131 RepID=A0AAV0WAH5_9HEMI|nr:unnamed protein product [Macrosiphum euphorbiae]
MPQLWQSFPNAFPVKQVPRPLMIRPGIPRVSQNFVNLFSTPAVSVVWHGYRCVYLVRLSTSTNKYLLSVALVSKGPRWSMWTTSNGLLPVGIGCR